MGDGGRRLRRRAGRDIGSGDAGEAREIGVDAVEDGFDLIEREGGDGADGEIADWRLRIADC